MREFQLLYCNTPVQSPPDFRFVGFLKQELNSFLEHRFRFFIRSTLAGDAQLGTRGHVPLAFFLDDCG